MKPRIWPACILFAVSVWAQVECPPTPAYGICEIQLELDTEELKTHPDPYFSVTIDAEFRSPRFRTFRLPAFWDGKGRFVLRFAPTEPGQWDYRITSNVKRFDGRTGTVTATPSSSPGFIRPRNVHHWGYTDSDSAHLWMGATSLRFGFLSPAEAEALIRALTEHKFNHLRLLVPGLPEDADGSFPRGRPDPAYFRALDQRILSLNKAGIIPDLVLAGGSAHLTSLFPSAELRQRYLRYVVGRYAAFHVTWQLVERFEDYDQSKLLMRELGTLLAKLDPYDHPRSTGATLTSSPFHDDGWMSYIVHNTCSPHLGAIERQLYPLPFVNTGVGPAEGVSLRSCLWNAAMNGQYPVLAPTPDPAPPAESLKEFARWFDFFSTTRYWDLEPYFDVDGGRALALEIPREEELRGVEYVVYIEKPGPVELVVQKDRYDVAWFNPATGERRKKGQFRGNRVRLTPPDASGPWLLHVSREAEKQRMLRRYKFESRRPLLQEPEINIQRIPFEIAEPAASILPLDKPVPYAARITRETRATRSMFWLWTGEVPGSSQGARVLALGPQGEMTIPSKMAAGGTGVLNLRLAGMNANGKVYLLDRVYRLEK